MKKAPALLVLSAALSFGAADLFGQAETGQIAGTVMDASGGIIPNATVIVTNAGTTAVRQTNTDANGLFAVPNLEPANYDVTVAARGLDTYKAHVTLTVGNKLGLDVLLQVGQTNTVVEVSDSMRAVNIETQTIQQTLVTQEVLELPTLSRNPYSLIVTSGNVSEADPSDRGAGVAINGLRAASTISFWMACPTTTNLPPLLVSLSLSIPFRKSAS